MADRSEIKSKILNATLSQPKETWKVRDQWEETGNEEVKNDKADVKEAKSSSLNVWVTETGGQRTGEG